MAAWLLLGVNLCLWAEEVIIDLPTLGNSGYYSEAGQVAATPTTGPNGGVALATRITVTSHPMWFYQAGKSWAVVRSMVAGETYQVTFLGRAVVGLPGLIYFKLQHRGDPSTGFKEQAFSLDADWTQYAWTLTAPQGLTPQTGELVLFVGAKDQTIELSSIRLVKVSQATRIVGDLLPGMAAFSGNGGTLIRTANQAGPGGVEATRLETSVLPDNLWETQLTAVWSDPVAAGDIFEGSVWMRQVPGLAGPAMVNLQFQRRDWSFTSDPWRTTAVFSRLVDHQDWRQVRFAFPALEAMATRPDNHAQVAVNLGFGPQIVELAGLVLTNRRRSVALASIPTDFATYAGREAAAPWRQAAAADIEKHRKADYTVRLRYASGGPVPGVSVRARLVRHEFGFGGSVKAEQLVGNGLIPAVRGIVTNWFNRVVFENDLKWGEWENPTKQARTMAALDWLTGQGLPVRGHTLAWPIFGSPAEAFDTPAGLRVALNGRVSGVAGLSGLRGRMADWDVVNEPTRYGLHVAGYDELYRSSAFGPALVELFQRARAADPAARRVLNEFGILEEEGGNPARKDRLKRHLRTLQAVSLDLVQAVGLQAHITDGGLMSPATLRKTLSEFQDEFGLPVAISEADFHIADPALRADYTRDFLTAAFSHPAVSEIMLWTWFANDWHKHAAMFDANWQVLPNGIVWSNLVKREWTSDVSRFTDATGAASFRGFKGIYELEVGTPEGGVRQRITPVAGVLSLTIPDPLPFVLPQALPPRWVGGELRLAFTVSRAGRYALERTDRFTPAVWTVVQEKSALAAGLIELVESVQLSGSRFYRLQWIGD